MLAPLPEDVRRVRKIDDADVAHFFVTARARLDKELRAAVSKMKQDAAIWISWPKKAAKVETDITEDTMREVALPLGLVDIKVCAVDETWSGLKLVIRKAAAEATGPLSVLKPSSSQPVIPPIMIFTGRPSRASRTAARCAPLQCGPAQ